MPRISIIIRAKNEEKWIGHCLGMMANQSEQDFEIILLDNQSQDSTVKTAKRKGIQHIVTIDNYLPGAALNLGISKSKGEFIVCLSAHCIPQNSEWLNKLVQGFEDNHIAGVYGRQIPLPFSYSGDKRDLLTTFGQDRRIQVKDYFFHNANSAIRRSVWEQFPFDKLVTNIEDRLWAKQVTEYGHRILYEPEAVVYHYHGIHHSNDHERLLSTVAILEKAIEPTKDLPNCMHPENVPVAAICPVLYTFDPAKMNHLITRLKQSKYVDQIYLISEIKEVQNYCSVEEIGFIKRSEPLMPPSTLEDLIKYALGEIERLGFFPELILYSNYLFPHHPETLFDDLIVDAQYKGLDSVFPACEDYHNYWQKNDGGQFSMIGNWLPHEKRNPIYKALNGLGTVTRSSFIRQGKLIGDRVGLTVLKKSIEKDQI